MPDPGSTFQDVPREAAGHFGLLFHATAYHLIYHLNCRAAASGGSLDQVLRDYPFLDGYFERIRERVPRDIDWPQSLVWLRSRIEAWEQAADLSLPLLQMRRVLRLPWHGALVFMLAGLVEEDAEFAALFAVIGQPPGEHRASVGLACQIFEGQVGSDVWQPIRALVDTGFLQVINRDAPRSQWVLRVPQVLWNVVLGETVASPFAGVRFHTREASPALDDLVMDTAARDQLTQLSHLAAAGRTRTVIVRGMPGTDRIGAAGALAHKLGCGLLEIDCTGAAPAAGEQWRLVGPLCTLVHAVPAFVVEGAPGETFEIPTLEGYRGPCTVLIGLEGGVGGPEAIHAVTVHMELESPANRLKLWTRALRGHASNDLVSAAAEFCLPGLYLRQCARLAIDYATIDCRGDVRLADLRQAARAINRQVLDTLAARIDGPADWSQLVVGEATSRELGTLRDRCRHRERLASAFEATIPGGLNRGVRALFEGPSGTGKTLAARVLANELGLDLYRVDLAAVVNKYIGETEKNLSRVLGRAEDLSVVLLLDEGDALMTRRTEVSSANDRYANLETNYLLQRLESYTGIVIVTTNAGSAIDPAFRRRMDHVVRFHLPDAEERLYLWHAHLPPCHAIDAAAIEEAAVRYQFTGGQIRNIAIRAAQLALGNNLAALRAEHLDEAIQAEHRKAGASFIERLGPEPARNDRTLAAFLGGLS